MDLDQFNAEFDVAADFGAGSGRWTARLVPYFSLIYALEPSDGANRVLRIKFKNETQMSILQEKVDANLIPSKSLDLAMSFGVLLLHQI